ncbi:MAG: hypothetical protein OQJ87_01135, partial [Rhodospirillales bacterium]|nr:hypothetical protein [Rhodospirillales bacterium]
DGSLGGVTFDAPNGGGNGATADHFTVIASDASGASLATGPVTVDIDISQGYQVASGGGEEALSIGIDD